MATHADFFDEPADGTLANYTIWIGSFSQKKSIPLLAEVDISSVAMFGGEGISRLPLVENPLVHLCILCDT